MKLSARAMLARLGAGVSISALCEAAAISRDEFDAWWRDESRSRVPQTNGTIPAAVGRSVEIARDEWGIPTIAAETDDDLFFGFGYAMAQDRLFQLDYLRRRGAGRLAEILGPSGLELDLIARTVGLPQIAEAEWERLPDETHRLVIAFSEGINALIAASRERLPIEFDLLEYVPEPWRPQDCLVIAGEFRWYLTGRFPVIAIPELAKRTLGDGPLYHAFLQPEADDESILPVGSYAPSPHPAQRVGSAVGDPAEGLGSNNWVVAGARSTTGKPLVASDPHIAFAAVSCWYEVHLRGGTFNVAGMAYAGMPAVMFGRNPEVAWGCTNNICSLRDLYQERTDAAHPGCFLYDGKWEPAHERIETIVIKGADPVRKTIRSSRNGPIVDEILPPPAHLTGPVSLRWQGREYCGWLTALLGMDRARTADEFRAAIEPWLVPTFSVVFADTAGHIGYQCTGRIPLRKQWERGYREGWNPEHQWSGAIPFRELPQLADPARGWIATANNRVAPEDFAYPLSGTWSSGHRALRIRQMIEEAPRLSKGDFARMHQDSVSVRGVTCTPALIEVLRKSSDPRIREALSYLSGWDGRMEPDRVGATLFEIFFSHWSRHVAEERFSGAAVTFVAGALGGLAADLLVANRAGWFHEHDREESIIAAFRETLTQLADQLGPEMLNWSWGRLHKIVQKHPLSDRGDLGRLLDRGGLPVRGDGVTVCNTGFDPNWGASMGAGYRLIADLNDPSATLYAIDAGSESGHPGSPHYDDQLTPWLLGEYHVLPLTGAESSSVRSRLILQSR